MMKTITEIKNEMGVSSKALRGYKKIGLLEPTNKPTGYQPWLYDEVAISKLTVIRILVKAKYSRKEIKDIFDHPAKHGSMNEVFETALERLKKDKKETDEMISFLELMLSTDSGVEAKECDTAPKKEAAPSIQDLPLVNIDELVPGAYKLSLSQKEILPSLLPIIGQAFTLMDNPEATPDSPETISTVIHIIDELIESNLFSEYGLPCGASDDDKRSLMLKTIRLGLLNLKVQHEQEDRLKKYLGEKRFSFITESIKNASKYISEKPSEVYPHVKL